jgi:hypothetical protein
MIFYHWRSLYPSLYLRPYLRFRPHGAGLNAAILVDRILKFAYLVEHLVRDEGVAGSNPATPTKQFNHLEFGLRRMGPDMGNETS